MSQSLPQPKDLLVKGLKGRKLDFLGILVFAFMMSSFLLLVDLGGRATATSAPIVIILSAVFAFSAICFVLVEAFWAKQPMLSPSLLRKAGIASQYILQVLLVCAQFSVSTSSPPSLVVNVSIDRLEYCDLFYPNGGRVDPCSCIAHFTHSVWQCYWCTGSWSVDQQVSLPLRPSSRYVYDCEILRIKTEQKDTRR